MSCLRLILAAAFLMLCLEVCVTHLNSSCATLFLLHQSHLPLYCQNFILESHPSRAVFLESIRSWGLPVFSRKGWQSAFTSINIHVRLPSSPHEQHNFEMTWILFLRSSPPISSSDSMSCWSRIRSKIDNLPSPRPLRSESQFQKQMTSALDAHCSYLL